MSSFIHSDRVLEELIGPLLELELEGGLERFRIEIVDARVLRSSELGELAERLER